MKSTLPEAKISPTQVTDAPEKPIRRPKCPTDCILVDLCARSKNDQGQKTIPCFNPRNN